MYKVLLVDDERTILEGISAIVDWKGQGVSLSGTARNGIEAMDFISQNKPDIVISDITMPGLDGIQLVEKSMESYPDIQWIFLSGFNEFEYAQKAMRFGIKHYLLKPCNENMISRALNEVVEELNEQKEQHVYLENIEKKVSRFAHEEKEQLFKELLTNKNNSREKCINFTNLLDITNNSENVQLLLFCLEDSYDYERFLLIKKFTQENFCEQFLTYTIIGDHLFVLIKNHDLTRDALSNKIDTIQNQYNKYDESGTTVSVSQPCQVGDLQQVSKKLTDRLDQRFYLGKGSLITSDYQTSHAAEEEKLYQYDQEHLILLLKTGHHEEALVELDHFFQGVREKNIRPSLAKSYLIQLYLSIVQKSTDHYGKDRLKEIIRMEELETLDEFMQFFKRTFEMIGTINCSINEKYSFVVERMIEVVQENIENPNLSLQWVANEKLYMNADYLGKLFKKEVGQRFSSFVTNKRIDKAVEIIEQEGNIKVFELADRLGFGSNPQYFSQIFKRITGCTPSDIIKSN